VTGVKNATEASRAQNTPSCTRRRTGRINRVGKERLFIVMQSDEDSVRACPTGTNPMPDSSTSHPGMPPPDA
jgi:hypothetical protein